MGFAGGIERAAGRDFAFGGILEEVEVLVVFAVVDSVNLEVIVVGLSLTAQDTTRNSEEFLSGKLRVQLSLV